MHGHSPTTTLVPSPVNRTHCGIAPPRTTPAGCVTASSSASLLSGTMPRYMSRREPAGKVPAGGGGGGVACVHARDRRREQCCPNRCEPAISAPGTAGTQGAKEAPSRGGLQWNAPGQHCKAKGVRIMHREPVLSNADGRNAPPSFLRRPICKWTACICCDTACDACHESVEPRVAFRLLGF
jgi:hypothetical protein